jgi:hypothetical protein
MKVSFGTFEEIHTELHLEAKNVLGGVVRMRIDHNPEQLEAVTFAVDVWVSAVIVNDSGPYLVEFADRAGSDDRDTPTGGSDRAGEWNAKLAELCDKHGLELREGRIEAV